MFNLPDLAVLTREQRDIFYLPLESTNLVIGPPGTGKSVLAIHRTQQLHTAQYNCKLILYGQVISQYMAQALYEKNIQQSATTFHQWFWRWYQSNLKTRPPQIREFVFDWGRILKDFEAHEEELSLPQLDHIVIDEGQDFPPGFYDVATLLAKHLTVFADENQRLAPDANSTINEIQQILLCKKVRKLTINFRNTRPIAELSNQFHAGAQTGKADLPERRGPKPVISQFKSRIDQLQFIRRYVEARPGDTLGIFVETQNQQRYYYEQLQQMFKNRDVNVEMYISTDQEFRTVDFSSGKIFIYSFKSAKGLQLDAVMLPDLQAVSRRNEPTKDAIEGKMLFYVLTSRASMALILSYVGETLPPFIRSLVQNEPVLAEFRQY